ncbi:hypothetical protein MPSEU_000641900 [Mayamaea pseudoterrestris]|nr:hypothetical protein MPSEU_000641900 [Mayamaea pseudoterrestris]
MRRRRGLYQCLIFAIVVSLWLVDLVQPATASDPYTILGASRNDSDSIIRKRYHKLCLRYHPDKQVSKSQKEKKRLEETFKKIQAAYAQINTAENRRQFEATSSMQSVFGNYAQAAGSSSFDTGQSSFNAAYADILRDFQRNAYQGDKQSPFGRVFSSNPQHSSIFPQFSSFGKSIYQETYTVPLSTLYEGHSSLNHSMRVNPWRRVVAAFRGGIAYPVLYSSFLYALAFLRFFGKPVTVVIWAGLFVAQLPLAPSMTNLRVPIQAGYKPGTKLTFSQNSMADIVLILQAEHHAHYKLWGNDLHTDCYLTPRDAQTGCVVRMKRLGRREDDLEVTIPPTSHQGDVIRIRGEGWPIRKSNGRRCGDLLVHVKLKGV